MSEEIQTKLNNKNANSPNNLLRIIYILIFLLAIIFVLLRIFFYKSPEEQLAAIEASLAIPDSENAAIIYNQLYEDYNNSDLTPAFLTPEAESITMSVPWSSLDYSEIANWLEQKQDIFEKLIDASKKEKCHFPIQIEPYRYIQVNHLSIMRKWAFLLRRATNNDIAENRSEDAISKCKCLIKIGKHLRQQPTLLDHFVGIGIESLGINQIEILIMESDINERHLQKIESFAPQISQDWTLILDRIKPVEKLAEYKYKEQLNLLERLKYYWQNRGEFKTTINKAQKTYLNLYAKYCGLQIIIALKRYKDKFDKWPEKLDEIKPYLSSDDILIDPQNKGSFVYKLKDDSFILYSTGLNGIDDNGKYSPRPADDWPIWPTQTSQVQSQNTSTKLSDPNME